MKITKRQLRRIIKENTGVMPMKSIASPEIQRMVSNSHRQRQMHEFYPIGGDRPSPSWEAFRDAAHTAAAEKIEAGMEADGIMEAMQDDIKEMIIDMESEWDDADENYDGGEEWTATSYSK